MKEQATLQNLSDFENKSLLICDDDNPFRERLGEQWKKRVLKFFKQKTAYEIGVRLVGSEMCIRDS